MDYIDGLDGSIARERSHSHRMGHIANPESSGWMVDGICDGMGDFFRFVAFIVTLHRVLNSGGKVTQNVGTSYTLLDIDTVNLCPVSIGRIMELSGFGWRNSTGGGLRTGVLS